MAAPVVRVSGPCLAAGYRGYRCSDRIECAHIIGRGEWCIAAHPDNQVPLCNIHHRYFTMHQIDWEDFIESVLPGRFHHLRSLILEHRESRKKIDWDYWYDYWKPLLDEVKRAA